ncbi:MAG: glycosyltransferase family 2 protein [Desulfobacterales bacterium]|nr:glycosyltransferase family 2 protein [Desulfobacterales bacterium]
MSKSIKISAVIITFNEEKNIGRCLDSLGGVADELVVVDSFSTDKTEEICNDKVVRFIRNPFEGHVEQKNHAVSLAKHDHILSLDADEALSEELRKSILSAKGNWDYDGYFFNRLTNYCGKWIRYCGWYPDKKLRLWDRRKGGWGGVNPHDKVIMNKNISTSHLKGDLLHYSYHTIRDHVSQMNKFSDIAARVAYEKGRRSNLIIDILLNPVLTFMKKYFIKLGILDGYYGFIISINSAFGKFLKYIKLRELN